MATLDLPTDPRTAVFRLIVAQLKADETLARNIVTWLVWDGSDDDSKQLPDVAPPSLRLSPAFLTVTEWGDESAQLSTLVVEVEAYLVGTDYDDVLNLWGAIERALYPADGAAQATFQGSLVAAGARNGIILFDSPFNEKLKQLTGAEGLNPLGTFRLDVLRTLIA